MAKKGIQLGVFVALAAIGLTIFGLTTVRAQGTMQATGGQMAELIAEVKLVRAALQEMAKGQSQVEVIGIQISAQQSRISQVSASLDAASNQLSVVLMRQKENAGELAAAQALVTRTPDPNQRATLEHRIPFLKQLANELFAEEQQLRSRVSRLTSTLNTEEQRWQQLSARLDGMVKR